MEELVSIAEIQGSGIYSPLADKEVVTHGIVTGYSRRGFFIQDPTGSENPNASCGIFVYSRKRNFERGSYLQVKGLVADYQSDDFDHPVTQLLAREISKSEKQTSPIKPVWLSTELLNKSNTELSDFLNAHEGMLMGIKSGATFIAPSNPFADYVIFPTGDTDNTHIRTETGGLIVNPDNPQQWFPSFRMVDYKHAVKLDVGSTLACDIVGPLNYRAKSYQLAISDSIQVKGFKAINTDHSENQLNKTLLSTTDNSITVLTLNGFNLDAKVEAPELVQNPRRDIDDDQGDGRFTQFAKVIVEQSDCPDIIALQEIQDSDGAEITDIVQAEKTYLELIKSIKRLCGYQYQWLDIPSEAGENGGQPGGNIRNAYLFNPERVSIIDNSLMLIEEDHPAFEGSRKPLQASFHLNSSSQQASLTIINVHLSSKRHQRGIFSSETPGYDEHQSVRVQQAQLIKERLAALHLEEKDYYLTGDFNACEFDETLIEITSGESINLLENLPKSERYDYNHRGKLLSLMHGITSKRQVKQNCAEYEILHGNELQGVEPGQLSGKASDHAYVIARLTINNNKEK